MNAAAILFTQAGDYQDAAERARNAADQYYADAYAAAVEAMENKDYKTAADLLAPLDRENVPETYENLPGMYEEACYRCANDLYADKKPFEIFYCCNIVRKRLGQHVPVRIYIIIKSRIQRVQTVFRKSKNRKSLFNGGKNMLFGSIFSVAEA